jgi:hypothetical protein
LGHSVVVRFVVVKVAAVIPLTNHDLSVNFVYRL